MRSKLYPLRLVINRADGWEYLECGHKVGNDYRYRIRRRCSDCEPVQ